MFAETKKQRVMKAHYMRVSTEGQNMERQFSDSGNEVMTGYERFKESISGRIPFNQRPKAQLLIEQIEAGKVKEVYVHSLDRLGRDTADVLNTVKYFTSKGVNLITKQEGLRTLNDDGTENPMAQLIVGIMSTLAEWDFNRRRTNTKEGIAVAKAKGKYVGRKAGTGMTDEKFLNKHKKIVNHLKAKTSIRDTAKLTDSSVSTVQKVKKVAEMNGIL